MDEAGLELELYGRDREAWSPGEPGGKGLSEKSVGVPGMEGQRNSGCSRALSLQQHLDREHSEQGNFMVEACLGRQIRRNKHRRPQHIASILPVMGREVTRAPCEAPECLDFKHFPPAPDTPRAAPLLTLGPGLFSYVRATGQADSGLIPTSPREMFACSGIYSYSLWIKERMGIIFPVGRRAYFFQNPSHKSGRAAPILVWDVSGSGAVLRSS